MYKILLTVDDAIAQKNFKDQLQLKLGGSDIIFTKNTQETITALMQNSIRLVVLDLNSYQVDSLMILAHMTHNNPDTPCFILGEHKLLEPKGVPASPLYYYVQRPYDLEYLTVDIAQAAREEILPSTPKGIPVSTFMQLISKEAKTSLLGVYPPDGNNGLIYFNKGILFDAVNGSSKGEDAARQMLRIENAVIRFKDPQKKKIARKIKTSLLSLIEDLDNEQNIAAAHAQQAASNPPAHEVKPEEQTIATAPEAEPATVEETEAITPIEEIDEPIEPVETENSSAKEQAEPSAAAQEIKEEALSAVGTPKSHDETTEQEPAAEETGAQDEQTGPKTDYGVPAPSAEEPHPLPDTPKNIAEGKAAPPLKMDTETQDTDQPVDFLFDAYEPVEQVEVPGEKISEPSVWFEDESHTVIDEENEEILPELELTEPVDEDQEKLSSQESPALFMQEEDHPHESPVQAEEQDTDIFAETAAEAPPDIEIAPQEVEETEQKPVFEMEQPVQSESVVEIAPPTEEATPVWEQQTAVEPKETVMDTDYIIEEAVNDEEISPRDETPDAKRKEIVGAGGFRTVWENNIENLREIRGYKAAALLDLAGNVVSFDSVDSSIHLDNIGVTLNALFWLSQDAYKRIGLQRFTELTIMTPTGLVLMTGSGNKENTSFHLLGILAEDGDQNLMRFKFGDMAQKTQDTVY